jgi:3-oxoacyl-[acyl-carrier protein] reductase
MRLHDRVALITGAARGIGLGIARVFAREGARLALIDLDAAGVQQAQAQVEAEGGEALAFPLDVTDGAGGRAVIADLLARWGRVDILVNNAGIYEILPFEEIDEARWDRVMAVNLKGAFLCSQAVVAPMKAQGWGRIINVASSAGKTGGTLAGAHYSVSKAGLICLTKQLARELGPHGITVNAVAPGRIDTPMIQAATEAENEEFRRRTPLGRLGTPEDVAAAVLFLASEEASFITGEILDVNGGLLID